MPNMNSPTIKQVLREFINNREEVTIEEIIEHLDYINKVRYSRAEVLKLLGDSKRKRAGLVILDPSAENGKD